MGHYYKVQIRVQDIDEISSEQGEELVRYLESLDLEVTSYDTEIAACGSIRLGGGTWCSEAADEYVEAIWKITNYPNAINVDWWDDEREPDDSQFFTAEEFNEMFPPLIQLAEAAAEERQDE